MKQSLGISILLIVALSISQSLLAGHPMENEMQHGSVDVPEGVAAPRLSVEVYPDKMSGFNLHIITQNFQLEPPEFMQDKPAVGVQGHAHLYINNKKVGRLYGPYVHISNDQLKTGLNMIAITINDHHHNTWRYQGKELIAAIILNTTLDKPVQSVHSPYPVVAAVDQETK